MAEIVVTAARVAPVFPNDFEAYDFLGGTAVAPGKALRINSSGKVIHATAGGTADVTTARFTGIALGSAGINNGVTVLKRGHVYGYTLTNQAYGAPIYLGADGVLQDAPGTPEVLVGRVVPLSDNPAAPTKVLYVDANWATEPSA